MNQLLKKLSAPVLSVFLVGGAFAFAHAAQPMQQPQINQKSQQQSKSQEQPNAQGRQQQSKAQQSKLQSVTGKVTTGGGLIAQNGQKFRLEGAKAAGLRHYANRTVTIKGYKTNFEGHNAIDVQSFRAGQSSMAQNNVKQPHNQSNFRSQNQGEQAPQPGHTGYMPKQRQQQGQTR